MEVGAARKIVSSPLRLRARHDIRPLLRASRSVDENAIGASGAAASANFCQSHLQHGIEIAEQNERDLGVSADVAELVRARPASVVPAAQGALAGALDRGTIGNGIAEWHAEFDHVGARFGGGSTIFCAVFERRIARRDVSDQAEFAALQQALESAGYTVSSEAVLAFIVRQWPKRELCDAASVFQT